MSLSVLVVDDEKLSRVTTSRQLCDAGYHAGACESAFTALKRLEAEEWDVILCDIRMPGMDGTSFLNELKKKSLTPAVIMMTAYASVETALGTIKAGAEDYLIKPFSFEELLIRLNKIEASIKIYQRLCECEKLLDRSDGFCGIVGLSPPVRQVTQKIKLYSDNPSNVLITGETGTGKELVARILHHMSPRKNFPFIPVACAAIPHDLFESEVFGHERGAFTGAVKQRKGKIEMANRGTLFLDDVDDLPLDVQPKLLRALEEKKFPRVGSEREIEVDIRVLSASKKNLDLLSEQDQFRRDLLYRLKVLEINVPPLRERKEDILPLITHFLRQAGRECCEGEIKFSRNALEILYTYNWPGNVRELQHTVEYAAANCKEGLIKETHLPESLIKSKNSNSVYQLNIISRDTLNLKQTVNQFEKDLILWAMKKSNGNQIEAAKKLQIPRTTLNSKLESMKSI